MFIKQGGAARVDKNALPRVDFARGRRRFRDGACVSPRASPQSEGQSANAKTAAMPMMITTCFAACQIWLKNSVIPRPSAPVTRCRSTKT